MSESPISTKVHPKFKMLLENLQNDRIRTGKETSQNKIPLWRLTKTIFNMIDTNKELYKSLVEVEINV